MPSDANALAAGIWPASAERSAVISRHGDGQSSGGELVVGGVSASALKAQYGTPLYVLDEDNVRARATAALTAFRGAFQAVGSSAKVYYAGKAFLSAGVARWMEEAGLHLDVCSGGELAVALAAGFDTARIGYHGNNKSVAEIQRAVTVGVGVIVVDSAIEVQRIAEIAARHGVRQKLRIRVNSGVHASTHDYLATAHEDQKFGIPLDDVPDIAVAIRAEDSLELLGLHSHIGSQIFDARGFVESASRLLAVHKELLAGGPLPELNLGGGFGIAYTTADDPTPVGEIARQFAEIVAAECARLEIPVPIVAVEPGRSIIGTPGITLYEVGTTKDVQVGDLGVRRYVSVDGGMSDNARPALYGADYSVRIASRVSDVEPALVRVAGKHCESGDIVVNADYLPGDVQPGDLLAVAATGAYCWSLSSNYNYLGRPPVVAVRGGTSRILIHGETEADLLRHDADITVAVVAPQTTTSHRPGTEHRA
nr:diaminopimelate decarboxylase [Naasia lichenicola]